MKKFISILFTIASIILLTGCSGKEEGRLHIAAASSLKNCLEEIYTEYQKEHDNIFFEGIYDGSGKLQVQIEEGLEADLFFSAATSQMDALVKEGYIDEKSVVNLLENKLVLVTNSDTNVTSMDNLDKASTIAIGDPKSVPAGQYAKVALGNQYDSLLPKLSLGTNVTEVLTWVEAGSSEVGFVYKTDTMDRDVKILQEIDLEDPVIYPVGIVKETKNKKESTEFLAFLKSDAALKIFEKYGFKGV